MQLRSFAFCAESMRDLLEGRKIFNLCKTEAQHGPCCKDDSTNRLAPAARMTAQIEPTEAALVL